MGNCKSKTDLDFRKYVTLKKVTHYAKLYLKEHELEDKYNIEAIDINDRGFCKLQIDLKAELPSGQTSDATTANQHLQGKSKSDKAQGVDAGAAQRALAARGDFARGGTTKS